MDAQPLYNLSPLVQLMLVGLALAGAPLLWVGLRQRQAAPAQRLLALTLLTLFLTFDLVLFGAFTRLTDSGLGCPDWPGCYGHASPVGAAAQIGAAQAAMPTGPVTHGKAWIEMIHRYLASGVGVLILTIAIATAVERHRAKRQAPPALGKETASLSLAWPLISLFWVCVQGAFGALTVTMKLFPAIVTLHLMGGVALLVLLAAQAARLAQAGGAAPPEPLAPRLRLGLWLVTGLVGLQIALGGWVSTNYAVLACSDFPSCQGQWWPRMDFAQGFEVWRSLGLRSDGAPIDVAALTAIHYAHRLMAYAVLAALALLVWQLRRAGALPQPTRWIAALALWQVLTGLSTVLLGWPLLAAVAHTGGAAGLMLALTWGLCNSRTAAPRPHFTGAARAAPSRA